METQKTEKKTVLTALTITVLETILAFCMSIALGTVDVYFVGGLMFVASPIFLLNYFLVSKTNIFDITKKDIEEIETIGKAYEKIYSPTATK